MKLEKFLKPIEHRDLENFISLFNTYKNDLTEEFKQQLLVQIVDKYSSIREFPFFKNIFDAIIGSKLNLNFNIDHWAPSFLSLVVFKTPSIEILDYFVRKGANINFIADFYFFENEELIEQEEVLPRYFTTLDIAMRTRDDMLVVDNFSYTYRSTEEFKGVENWRQMNCNETIEVNKKDYFELIEQSMYLQNLILIDELIDYIVLIGGKEYDEITEATKNK
jgi:hypothetical protein